MLSEHLSAVNRASSSSNGFLKKAGLKRFLKTSSAAKRGLSEKPLELATKH